MSDTENQWPNGDGESPRPAVSRTVLGVLLALLVLAVVVALWALLTGGDDNVADDVEVTTAAVPTALPIPTSTPAPTGIPEDAPTPTPTPVPTALPEGFEACGDSRAPLLSATYIVDTLSTPLNQRAEPAVDGALMGTFEPAQSGLVFTGDCVVNLSDGYVWWEINNGTDDVWIASSFVTPN